MKPIKKDAPRQARRERTLTRLENYLKGGVKKVKAEEQNKGVQPDKRLGVNIVEKTVPFEQKDIDRIQKEIGILKSRLGRDTKLA